MPSEGFEHILVDQVAASVMEPAALDLLFCIGHEREFHTDTGDVTEHLLEFDLLGMHEHRIRDFRRTEFLALATVDTGICDVSEADEVEHEVRGYFSGGDV